MRMSCESVAEIVVLLHLPRYGVREESALDEGTNRAEFEPGPLLQFRLVWTMIPVTLTEVAFVQ